MTQTRNFPDFLDAYFEYAQDHFCPDRFHLWTGVSLIAGAMERKCWVNIGKSGTYIYPNLLIMLVSRPGMGKTSAGNLGVYGLLRHLEKVKILPAQVTEAKFIDLMSEQTSFAMGTRQFLQCAGYFYAPEGSNSLKNIFGDFIACITDFYDCPPNWERGTKKDGRITLTNVCFNMLVGCTFDYLGKLITDENVMGGFASRLVYVIHDEKVVRPPVWNVEQGEKAEKTRALLLEDLKQIHSMTGAFNADADFRNRYMEWWPVFDRERQNHPSEKMQSLMVRKQTNLFKLAMVICASEGNDKVLKARHWDRALRMLDQAEAALPRMLQETTSQAGGDSAQRSLNMAIVNSFGKRGDALPMKDIFGQVLKRGYYPERIKQTLRNMIDQGQLTEATVDARVVLTLNVDPNNYI